MYGVADLSIEVPDLRSAGIRLNVSPVDYEETDCGLARLMHPGRLCSLCGKRNDTIFHQLSVLSVTVT